jgi:hypothetical protein
MGIHQTKRGGQGGHRKVVSEELEARSRAVTNAPMGQLKPVGQAEDAEPAARWRRHILDKSADMVRADSTGSYLSSAVTRGSLVGSEGSESSVADHIRETEIGQ